MNENSVMIVGGGHQGLAMAAHLALNGNECYLWNRTLSNIERIHREKTIISVGVVNGVAKIQNASDDILENLQKLIMVTTPSSAHKGIAKMLAAYVDETYTILLNPGRTFGVVEFRKELKKNGCKSMPVLAETQTIVYTCRKLTENKVSIYALKKGIPLAGLREEDTTKALNNLPNCLKEYFVPAKSYIETSLGNVGMILHCAPVLMNIGWIESEKVDFKYYYDGISQTVANFIQKVDNERVAVAKAMGCEMESLSDWLIRTYHTSGTNLYERLQNNQYYKDIDAPLTINHRYIEEDVPMGLVPLESMGRIYGVPTPNATLVIDLANAIMEKDYRKIGRTFGEDEIRCIECKK